MINRIVKMTFEGENTEAFQNLFENVKNKIENFEGCHGVKLLRDVNNPSIFFTYSLWDDENYLNAYRKSALFDDTWSKTKALFSQKPEAWSVLEQ
ncbi:MAG: putative quinol monooxygenase [Bacteroidia bacterium]